MTPDITLTLLARSPDHDHESDKSLRYAPNTFRMLAETLAVSPAVHHQAYRAREFETLGVTRGNKYVGEQLGTSQTVLYMNCDDQIDRKRVPIIENAVWAGLEVTLQAPWCNFVITFDDRGLSLAGGINEYRIGQDLAERIHRAVSILRGENE